MIAAMVIPDGLWSGAAVAQSVRALEENPASDRFGTQIDELSVVNLKTPDAISDAPLGVDLAGIVLTTPQIAEPVSPETVGIVTAFTPPDGVDLAAALDGFVGTELSLRRIAEIRRATLRAYRDAGRGFVAIVAPPQDLSEGVLTITVSEFTLGDLRVEGATYSDEEYLLSTVSPRLGETIDSDAFVEDINWLNLNPYRNLTVVAEPGKEFGETDLILRLDENRPATFFLRYANSGSESTGQQRFSAGFHTVGLLLDDNHLSYQYTTSEEGPLSVYGDVGRGDSGYGSHDGYYLMLLPWRHQLRLRGALIDSRSEPLDPFVSDSSTMIGTATYTAPLGRVMDGRLEAFGQIDYKHSERELFFNGASISDLDFDTLLLSGGLRMTRLAPGSTITGSVRIAHSPGGIGADNNDASAAAFAGDPDAEADFSYIYGSFDYERGVTDAVTLRLEGAGQLASETVPSTESFSVGGASTVRGYRELEASGDAGGMLSLELGTSWLPHVSAAMRGPLRRGDAFAFFDVGHTHDSSADAHETLAGAGVGMSLALGKHVLANGTIGVALTDGPQSDVGDLRAHVGLTVRF